MSATYPKRLSVADSGLKFYPAPGSPVTLVNSYSGAEYPYTVVGRAPRGRLLVRQCQLIFKGDRYYDSYPDAILPGRKGYESEVELIWKPKLRMWAEQGKYGKVAIFGKAEFCPNLN